MLLYALIYFRISDFLKDLVAVLYQISSSAKLGFASVICSFPIVFGLYIGSTLTSYV